MRDPLAGVLRDVTLSPNEASSIGGWCARTEGGPYANDYEPFVAALLPRIGDLPDTVHQLAAEIRGRLGSAGVMRVRGVKVPTDLPPTPRVPFVASRVPTGTEALLLGLGQLLGTVMSFDDWHEGDRVQNLYPLPSEAAKQNASNSVYLELHTETAFRPNTPHLLLLLCLREDRQASTFLCDVAAVWRRSSEEARRMLAEPGYGFETDRGFTEPKPAVVGWPGGLRFNYAEAVRGVTPGHQRALEELEAGIHADLAEITLVTGDLVIIDNLHIVHGRSGYRPRYDGSDRWLQRCLVRSPAIDVA